MREERWIGQLLPHTLVLRLPVVEESEAYCCHWRQSAGKAYKNQNSTMV
jgi:hypothetical protein